MAEQRGAATPTQAGTAETFGQVVDGFQRKLKAVAENQWKSSTPCTEWDVRALVNHVVGELLWIPPLLEGQTLVQVGDRFAGDVLGSDPKGTAAGAADKAVNATQQAGAMERTVHLSSGDGRAEDYISEVGSDVVIHTWDLARGIGAEDRIDDRLLDFANTVMKPRVEAWRAGGAFAAAIDVPKEADAQTKVLAMVGRRG